MNPGATNVLRIAGEKAAALTLAGDSLKGFLPIIFFHILYNFFPMGVDTLTIVLVGLGAFLVIYIRSFLISKGGKGVATAFGVLLGWNPVVAILSVGIWGAVFLEYAHFFAFRFDRCWFCRYCNNFLFSR